MPAGKLFSGPDDGRIRRALCIVAHPDDIDFYCSGAVVEMASRGVEVSFVLVTSGDKGSDDPIQSAAQLAATREAEQIAAAELLGVAAIEFLRLPDAEVTETLELRGLLVRSIRRTRPDVMLSFDPTPDYRQHPDHRAVGRVALDAAWPSARDRLAYPDLGPPHQTAEAWLFAGPRHDLVLKLGPEVIETKIEARLCHRSQTASPRSLRARWRKTATVERFAQIDLR